MPDPPTRHGRAQSPGGEAPEESGSPHRATVRQLLDEGRQALARAPFGANARDGALLLAHALGREEVWLLAHDDAAVEAAAARSFRSLLARRAHGEPLAYQTGEKEFFGRRFRVDRRVLIPRPETEHLVEVALGLPLPAAPQVLDLGTGSGCLAVTLALELAEARVVAVDLSPGALAVAAANVVRLGGAGRVTLLGADLARPLLLDGFDLVVSNPPYLEPDEKPGLSPEVVDHEPHLALFPPGGFRALVVRLLDQAADLRSGGHLLFEIGQGQTTWIGDEVARHPFELLEVRPDLAGIPRVVVLRRR